MSTQDGATPPAEGGNAAATGYQKRVRGGHRAHLTKVIADITTKLASSTGQEDSLRSARACLERKAVTLSKLDEEILVGLEDAAEMATEIEATENIQNEIQEQIIKIDKVLNIDEKKDVKVKSSSSSSSRSGGGANIKMPKYECSDFHGDPKKWIAFRDSFGVAVAQKDLSDVEKFHYLRNYLKGEALRAIDGLAVTNENYSEAYEILEKRFGNKQMIVNSHMEELCSIIPVEDKDDTKGLRRLYDTVEVNLRSLRALKVDPKQYGTLLVPMLKNALPADVVLLLSRKFDSKDELWELDKLLEELRLEIEARERCYTGKEGNDGERSSKDPNKKKRMPSTGDTLLSVNSKLSCPYCERPHYPDKCRTVTDVAVRKTILVDKKRCFICTKGGHAARNCKAKRMCIKCQGRHHTSICEGTTSAGDGNQNESKDGTTMIADSNVASAEPKTKKEVGPVHNTVLLQTALVTVSNPKTGKSMECRAILDNASNKTYSSQKIQDALGVTACGKDTESTGTFGGGSTEAKPRDVVVLAVQGGKSETLFLKTVVVEKICRPLHGQAVDVAKGMYAHLYGLPLADETANGFVEIEMLIGLDYYWDIITGVVVRGQEGPVAMESKFGYILSGASKSWSFVANTPSICNLAATLIAKENEDVIAKELRNLWELETIGIANEDVSVESERSDIRFDEEHGQYEVAQAWKSEHRELGDNHQLAKSRTVSNIRRYKRNDADLLREYHAIMMNQVSDGVLERVSESMVGKVGKTYYMPHQLVVRKDKETTKVRVVYDCSSKMHGNPSLNDCLRVPDAFYTDLFAVVIRFRTHRIGLIADIEKAFLRIRMREEDRDAHRLVWVKDPFADRLEFETLRFTTVTFGAGPSMWQLGSVVKHHLQKYSVSHPVLVNEIENSLYADDFSGGGKDDEDASTVATESKKIFKDAGMNLRKWRSNSKEVMKIIAAEESGCALPGDVASDSHATMMLNPGDNSPVKVLGTPWDVDEDVFRINLSSIVEREDNVKTKVES